MTPRQAALSLKRAPSTERIPDPMRWNALPLICAAILAGCATGSGPGRPAQTAPVDASFFDRCAFVSVDIQEGKAPAPLTDDQIPEAWRKAGFTADDVNAANRFAWETALPNAVRVAEACRALGMPMIFIHWGYQFENGMDLDPDIRRAMLAEHGEDYAKWSGHAGQKGSQVAGVLGVREGDYVLAKTAQDAFQSCSLEFVLRNLRVERIVFVGGHTGACLGKTARSAGNLGFKTLCVRDATSAARESVREREILETGYDHVLDTAEFLSLARGAGASPVTP